MISIDQYHDQYHDQYLKPILTNIDQNHDQYYIDHDIDFLASKLTSVSILLKNFGTNRKIDFFNIGSSGSDEALTAHESRTMQFWEIYSGNANLASPWPREATRSRPLTS